MTPVRQWELSNELGTTKESPSFETSPHTEMVRFSNDKAQGVYSAASWHINGPGSPEPDAYCMFHCVKAMEGVSTSFVPTKELFHAQSADTQRRWRELRFVANNGRVRPFIKNDQMIFNLLALPQKKFIRDLGLPSEQHIDTDTMKFELEMAIDSTNLEYRVDWKDGDVVLMDNKAVAHTHRGHQLDAKGHKGHKTTFLLDATHISPKKRSKRSLQSASLDLKEGQSNPEVNLHASASEDTEDEDIFELGMDAILGGCKPKCESSDCDPPSVGESSGGGHSHGSFCKLWWNRNNPACVAGVMGKR